MRLTAQPSTRYKKCNHYYNLTLKVVLQGRQSTIPLSLSFQKKVKSAGIRGASWEWGGSEWKMLGWPEDGFLPVPLSFVMCFRYARKFIQLICVLLLRNSIGAIDALLEGLDEYI